METYSKALLELEELHDSKIMFSSYFLRKGKKESSIDDGTFNDLMLDNIFFKFFCPYFKTSLGEQILYNDLRNPIFNKDELLNKRKKLDALDSSPEKSSLIHYLNNIGTLKYYNFSDILFKPLKTSTLVTVVASISFIITLLTIILSFHSIAALFLLAIPLLIYPFISGVFFDSINSEILILRYLSKVVSNAKYISNLDIPEFSAELSTLKKLYNKFKYIKFYSNFLGQPLQGTDTIITLLDVFAGTRALGYLYIAKKINKNKKDYIKMIEIIGALDSFVTINEIKDNNSVCKPTFTDDKTFSVQNIYNPIIDNCVKNSITLNNNGILLTGSNMAGKSTFLRSIGLNVILSQTIGIVFADNYTAPISKIFTSISRNDDLLSGKSYYLEEAEAVQYIVNNCNNDIPMICIIDEIFKGTNPTERIAAATEICNYLSSSNCIPFIATHDSDLTKSLENYKLYHFSETINDDLSMTFDYKLKEGICPSSNAIKILEILEYPKEILDKIKKRIS